MKNPVIEEPGKISGSWIIKTLNFLQWEIIRYLFQCRYLRKMIYVFFYKYLR